MLFARNWAALRTALAQGAALLTVFAAVCAAVLHAGRWRVDAQGTLRVRWRLGVRLDRCLKAVHDRMDWDHKYPVREIGNGKVRAVGMGMAMQGSGIDHVDVGSATLKINDDGFYTLSIGAADMGTGCDTILAQIAAEVLECPLEIIAVLGADTDSSPYDSGSYASSTTYVTGKAVEKCALELKDKICTLGAQLLGLDTAAVLFTGDAVTSTTMISPVENPRRIST